jgi:hypothetical protein
VHSGGQASWGWSGSRGREACRTLSPATMSGQTAGSELSPAVVREDLLTKPKKQEPQNKKSGQIFEQKGHQGRFKFIGGSASERRNQILPSFSVVLGMIMLKPERCPAI